MRKMVGVLAWAALAVLVIAAPATADPGDLDRGFGDRGRAAIPLALSDWRNAAIGLDVARDNSLLVAGERELLRFDSAGDLDPAFGAQGKLALPPVVEGMAATYEDAALDPLGRIVAFGYAEDTTGQAMRIPGYYGLFVRPTRAVVVRFDAEGNLDPSFGGGDGIVLSELGLPREWQVEGGATPPLVWAVAGAIDAQGRPVILAATVADGEDGAGRGRPGRNGRAVARLTSAGELDLSFGGGDGVTALGGLDFDQVTASKAGVPLLISGAVDPGTGRAWLAGLDFGGSLTPDFGGGGWQPRHGGGGDVAVDRRGRILLLERPSSERNRVYRLRPNGALDRGFGRGGSVDVGSRWRTSISSVAVDGKGRVYLAGTAPRPHQRATRSGDGFSAAVRLTARGTPDRSFGHRAWIRTGFGRRTSLASAVLHPDPVAWRTSGVDAAVDTRGRLVVAGAAHSPQLTPGGVVLARYAVR